MTGPPTIVEVGDFCAVVAARSLDLFEVLGEWCRTTAPGPLQQLWLVACHRHGWHAELCRDRMPTIPLVDANGAIGAARGALDVPRAPAADWYIETLTSLRRHITALRTRTDPTIDPSTTRLCTLLATDLDELIDHRAFQPQHHTYGEG